MPINLSISFLIFTYGILIGSFLNVCIYRIPLKEDIVKVNSHCMNCGYKLRYYDLIPILSYIFLGGKCRECKTNISIQYPAIEGLNGLLYVIIYAVNGINTESIIYMLFTSVLIVISIIDFKTYEIPISLNRFILILGIARVIFDIDNYITYLIGFFIVSGFLYILYLLTKGRGIGGGDIKLMAVSGLILGYKLIILAFLLGCIIGSVIHLLRMKISKADKVLAFGPYLSIGIWISMLFGQGMIDLYISLII